MTITDDITSNSQLESISIFIDIVDEEETENLPFQILT